MWLSFGTSDHVDVVKILLENKAQVGLQNNNGWPSLKIASHVVIILLENEAHVDIQEEHGWTSLMVLSQNGHVNVVKLLL